MKSLLLPAVLISLSANTYGYEYERINRQKLNTGDTIEWKVTSEGYQTRRVKENKDGSTSNIYIGKQGYGQVRETTNRDGSINRTGDLSTERKHGW